MTDSFRLRNPACEKCGKRGVVVFVWTDGNLVRWLANLPLAVILGFGICAVKYQCTDCGIFWTRSM